MVSPRLPCGCAVCTCAVGRSARLCVPQDGTALVWAVYKEQAAVARLLLDRGALVGATDNVRDCQPTRCCVAHDAAGLRIAVVEPRGTAAAVLPARLLCAGWAERRHAVATLALELRVGYTPVGVRGLGAAFKGWMWAKARRSAAPSAVPR